MKLIIHSKMFQIVHTFNSAQKNPTSCPTKKQEYSGFDKTHISEMANFQGISFV